MGAYAHEIEQLAKELATFLKPCDDNGMELMFMSNAPGCKSKSIAALVDRVRERRGRYHTITEPRRFLERIFKEYARRWRVAQPKSAIELLVEGFERVRSGKMKPVSYFILTDAVWQEDSKVEQPICELLRDMSGSPEDQVAISFVQFGDDEEGTQRLRFLDEDLVGTHGKDFGIDRDVVDHTRWDGDVLKMVLGPMDSRFDRIGERRLQPG